MSKPHNSLPRKLSITLILLAAPVFIVTLGTFYKHVQELMHKEALERSYSILNTTMQKTVNYMCAVRNAAKANAWLLEDNFNPDSLQAISRRIVSLNKSVLSCSVSTEPNTFPELGANFSVYSVNEGDTIITVREPNYDYYERKWYQTALQTGKDCWVDPFSDFNEGTMNLDDAVASYCIPLRPDGMHIQGVVSTDFSFNRLAQIIRSAEHPFPTAYYMLLGTDGRYLVHPETNFIFRKTIFSVTDTIQHPDIIALGREMTAGKRGIMHISKDEKTYHVCYAPVPDTHWSLAMVCLDDEILNDYNHLLYLGIVVVIVGLLLIMLFTAHVIRQTIKPIHNLLEATNQIAGGNYNLIIPECPRKDTVGRLQNAFIAMRRAIVKHMTDVKRTTEEVEQENKELEQAMHQAQESSEKARRFTSHVLRQIRMPLNIIEGLTDTLLSRHLSESELQVIRETMKINVIRLNRRVSMLYDSSDSRASNKELYQRNTKLPCNEVAQEAIHYMDTWHAHLEFRLETNVPDDVCIRTNHLFLLQSISELLHNAAKFSDGKHIKLRVTQTDSVVRFIVEDTGPGMPKEWHEIISQPFMQADEQSPGLGLGLPLVNRHITSLGGQLIYDTDYKEGCRIIIEMPKES